VQEQIRNEARIEQLRQPAAEEMIKSDVQRKTEYRTPNRERRGR
jgi:hypothetical protein